MREEERRVEEEKDEGREKERRVKRKRKKEVTTEVRRKQEGEIEEQEERRTHLECSAVSCYSGKVILRLVEESPTFLRTLLQHSVQRKKAGLKKKQHAAISICLHTLAISMNKVESV